MALFSQVDLTRIETAIAAAEAQSAGEIVVATVGRCDRYDLPRAIMTGAWTIAAAVAADVLVPAFSSLWLLVLQIPTAVLLWHLLGIPFLLRWLIRPSQAAANVRSRAFQLFAEQGVYRTRDKSGLLIVIAELEHRVMILGDQGIHAQIGSEGWERHVAAIIAGIKRGDPAGAVVQVIDGFAKLLAEKFPRRPDDTNELPNAVVVLP